MKFFPLEPVQVLLLLASVKIAASTASSTFQLTVLHTNDLHARFSEVTAHGAECKRPKSSRCYGGVARLKHVVDKLKDEEPNVLFLNAGDFFQVRLLIAFAKLIKNAFIIHRRQMIDMLVYFC